jgi:hypothetical protein
VRHVGYLQRLYITKFIGVFLYLIKAIDSSRKQSGARVDWRLRVCEGGGGVEPRATAKIQEKLFRICNFIQTHLFIIVKLSI